MTISTVYDPISYNGNGVTVSFPVPFQFWDETDLVVKITVIATGVSTTQTLTTHYSVFGGDGETGSITLVTAPALTEKVTIELDIPFTQGQDYEENSAFPAEVLEEGFDRLTVMAQQANSAASRALVIPATDTGVTTTLPDKATRAGKALYFDADGNPSTTTDTDTVSAAAAAASASAASASETAAAASATAAQNAAAGLKWRPSVRIASTANLASISGLSAMDGVTPVAGDRILLKDQSTASQNGVYVAAAGAWTRATDADSWTELVAQVVTVEEGSTNDDKIYICTVNAGGTLGSTSVTWTTINTSPTIASQAEAEAGSDNTKMMTALRTKQAIDYNKINDGVSVYQTTGTTIPNDLTALTTILFDTEEYDDNGWHSTSVNTGRITVDFTGRILLIGNVDFNNNGSAVRTLAIKKNGSVVKFVEYVPAGGASTLFGASNIQITDIQACAPTDYFEMAALSNATATATGTGITKTSFKGLRVK